MVTWTASTGANTYSHIVHVDQAGLTWALDVKDSEAFDQFMGDVTKRPAKAVALLEGHPSGKRLPRKQLASVAFTEQLNLLTIVDKAGKKYHVAFGGGGVQGKVFEAIRKHLGGTLREEDADAWSIMQVPLFSLAVLAVIGGFFIWFTTLADPDAEISGRREGMQRLVNWLGYTIGPMWMSIAVGSLAFLILSFMTFLLIKRPKRQVLEF